MTVFPLRAIDVFAGADAGGNPRDIKTGEAQSWGVNIERAIVGAEAGRVDQVTWSGLSAISGTRIGQPAFALGPDSGTHTDPVVGGTVPNVGAYVWSASPAGWRRVGNLPTALVAALNAGAGTANAVQATAAQSYSTAAYEALITVNFVAANTGPMTLSINNETPRDIVTNTGGATPSGYVSAGIAAIMQIDANGDYRMFSYGDPESIQIAAEAAAAAAVAAQTAAEDARDDAIAAMEFTPVTETGTISGVGPYDMGILIGTPYNLDLIIGGVPQYKNTYTVDGTEFTLTSAAGISGQTWEATVKADARVLNSPADGSVGTPQLASAAVTAPKIADDAVTTPKIMDENVTEAKLAAAFLAKLGLGSEIFPAEYGAVGDNVANDNTALTSWIGAWKSSSPEKDAILTTGTYLTTTQLPNLLNPNGRFIGKGRPRIRYAGSTVTDLIYVQGDQNRYGQYFGNFEIDGNSLTQGLLMTDKIHHSTFENIYLRNCHPGYQAMRTIFAVMNTYRNIVCSDNNGGAFDYTPYNGLIIGAGTSAATQTIDCTFERLILEGINSTGLALVNSWYNTFINGTSEGNGQGVAIADYSRCNTFINFFCEVNATGDFYIEGHSNAFINCEGLSPTNAVTVIGDNNVFIGGRYDDFTINAGATGTILDNVEILGSYTDNGSGTVVR